jgi:hypothetical protein
MKKLALLLVLGCFAFGSALQAQVAVSAQSVEKKQYTSPMSLDVNFNLAHKSLWGQGRVAPKQSLDAFICEGIYVSDFGMEGKGKGKGDGEQLEATIYFTLNAENGAPKRKVSATIQLFDGETAISGVVKGDTVKLKDNDREKQKIKITVPYSKLKTEPLTTLKLTLKVDK